MEKTFPNSSDMQVRDHFLAFDDAWVLRQRVKCYKIQCLIKMLFDKVSLEMEHGESLQTREAKVTVYKQPRSKFYFLNIMYLGKRFRFSNRCESKKDAQKVGILLISKLLEKSVSPGSIQYTTEQTNSQSVSAPVFEEASYQYVQEECKGKKIAW